MRKKTEVKERIKIRERLRRAKEEGEIGETLKYRRWTKRRHRNENVFVRPNELRENSETAISCR